MDGARIYPRPISFCEGPSLRGSGRPGERPFEEVREARVEGLQVLGSGDTVSLVLEGEQLVGDAQFVEVFRDGVDVVLGDIRVPETLHDQKLPADVLHEVHRRALAVAVRNL